MLYVFFWVIPRRLNFIYRRFGTLCLFHLHRQVGASTSTFLPVKVGQTECSETSAYEIQTPGNHPKEAYNNVKVPIRLLSAAYFYREKWGNCFFLKLVHIVTKVPSAI